MVLSSSNNAKSAPQDSQLSQFSGKGSQDWQKKPLFVLDDYIDSCSLVSSLFTHGPELLTRSTLDLHRRAEMVL